MAAKSPLNPAQLFKTLEKTPPGPAYLMMGEEETEKEKAIAAIIDSAARAFSGAEVSHARFHADQGEFAQALAFSQTPSMFSPATVTVISGIDALPSTRQTTDQIKELLESASPCSIVVMTSPSNKLPATLSAADAGEMTVVRFWKKFEEDLVRIVTRRFTESNISAYPGSAEYLVSMTGRNLGKIEAALEKIELSGARDIDPKTIADLIGFERDISVFEFIDALFLADPASLRYLVRLLDESTPELVILNMISRQAETLDRFHSLSTSMPVSEVMAQLRIQERQRGLVMNQASRYSADLIARVFPLIFRCESHLKSSRLSKRTVANPLFMFVSDMLLLASGVK